MLSYIGTKIRDLPGSQNSPPIETPIEIAGTILRYECTLRGWRIRSSTRNPLVTLNYVQNFSYRVLFSFFHALIP